SFGHVLLNRGQGRFEYLPSRRTGLELPGEIRDIVYLPGATGRLLVLQNNEVPALYRVRPVQQSVTKNDSL
ncbi:MAG TPA: hypothetical protein VHK69_04845, partial [Chitinophagaceae bacterium]|nr:hypothetical protein [Chitinophagaceae bacterium]